MTIFTMAMFGSVYKTSTGLLHNLPCGHWLAKREEPVKTYVMLRGKVFNKGQWQFKTRVAEPYPVDLGEAYGEMAEPSLLL